MTYYSTPPSSDELYHYGIKGMRWGVRRYENEDRTLTEAGKERYDKKSKRKETAKKLGKILGATLGTAAAAYGGYKLYNKAKNHKIDKALNALIKAQDEHKDYIKRLDSKASEHRKRLERWDNKREEVYDRMFDKLMDKYYTDPNIESKLESLKNKNIRLYQKIQKAHRKTLEDVINASKSRTYVDKHGVTRILPDITEVDRIKYDNFMNKNRRRKPL